jgi:transcriptional regulator with XRE-family HTH domain
VSKPPPNERIKSLRHQLTFTKSELAAKINSVGMGPKNWSAIMIDDIETGRIDVMDFTVRSARRIATALGVTLDSLFG